MQWIKLPCFSDELYFKKDEFNGCTFSLDKMVSRKKKCGCIHVQAVLIPKVRITEGNNYCKFKEYSSVNSKLGFEIVYRK